MIKKLICLIWGHKPHSEPVFVVKENSHFVIGQECESFNMDIHQPVYCKRCGLHLNPYEVGQLYKERR